MTTWGKDRPGRGAGAIVRGDDHAVGRGRASIPWFSDAALDDRCQTFTAPGQILVGSDGTDTIVAINTDRDPDTEAAFRLAGLHVPEASWFVL